MDKTAPARQRWILAILLLAAAGMAGASPKPGGVYRLKPGIYVAAGSECGAPANAAIRRYDGKGISTAHTQACKAKVLKRRGRHYTVSQSCLDAGPRSTSRRIQHQEVTVKNAQTFTQDIAGNVTTYHYCPVGRLPPDLRKAAR